MKQLLERHLAAIVAGLAALVVVSLAFNGYLLYRSLSTDDRVEEVAGGAALLASQASGLLDALDGLGPVVDGALDEIDAELTAFQTSTITFAVAVDEEVPVSVSFPFQRTIEFPIRTTLPIDEQFETRIEVSGPFGVDIPLNVTVPIRLDVPIELDLQIPIDETIDIDTTIPLQLDVPVEVDVAGSELARLAARIQEGLAQLRDLVAGLN